MCSLDRWQRVTSSKMFEAAPSISGMPSIPPPIQALVLPSWIRLRPPVHNPGWTGHGMLGCSSEESAGPHHRKEGEGSDIGLDQWRSSWVLLLLGLAPSAALSRAGLFSLPISRAPRLVKGREGRHVWKYDWWPTRGREKKRPLSWRVFPPILAVLPNLLTRRGSTWC